MVGDFTIFPLHGQLKWSRRLHKGIESNQRSKVSLATIFALQLRYHLVQLIWVLSGWKSY